ncbi:MAG: hypothetical protein KBG28_15745 [Kofleriaceae bacterium]|nr:hypothetical protein [Kofleriaceae bacterium]MBP9205424.1 hypothetical protein [Kofleriaceae bacterium]
MSLRSALALPFMSLLLVPACTAGERASSGECPADEACSDTTPYGLHFTATPLVGYADQAPKPVAIGGTQEIELWRRLGADAIIDEVVALDVPFAAMSDNGDAVGAAILGTSSVRITGVADGRDLLRITEAGNDLLLDRYEVSARALAAVRPLPFGYEQLLDPTQIAFLAGPTVTFGLGLYSAEGERLADHSLTVAGAAVTTPSWDTVELAAPPVGPISLNVTAGGAPRAVEVTVVDAVDQLVPGVDNLPDTIVIGSSGSVCFEAHAGARAVVDLDWTFTVAGAGQAVGTASANCVSVQATAAGLLTIDASAAGSTTRLELTVAAAAARAVRPTGDAGPGPRAAADAELGQRAALTTR